MSAPATNLPSFPLHCDFRPRFECALGHTHHSPQHKPTAKNHHNQTGEDNANADLKRQIMSRRKAQTGYVCHLIPSTYNTINIAIPQSRI